MIFSIIMGTSLTTYQKNVYNPIIAHRGGWNAKNLPENSIASLKHAIELGCAGSEFDVHMTADNILVICHDSKFYGLEIEKVNYQDLLTYVLSNKEKIPTLEAYLKAGTKKNKHTRLVLEIKPSGISKERSIQIAENVYNLVKKMKAENMIDYISFDIDILKTLINLNPSVSTQYLNGDMPPMDLKALGISGLDYNFKVYKQKPQWIPEAKKLNLILNAWTVNDVDDIDFFLSQNFDFITTNEPELAKERLDELMHSK
ncbi:MAG: glycerophosphodiester phosphodiesterase family protein [Saprospiraceae bacterium]